MPIITQPLSQPLLQPPSQPPSQPPQPQHEKSEDLDETQVVPPSAPAFDRSSQVKTPEPRIRSSHAVHVRAAAMDDQRSPGHIPTFDWDEFERRYERALADSNDQEKELLDEFDRLVKVSTLLLLAYLHLLTCTLQYFNVWASAAAAHDNERAIKR